MPQSRGFRVKTRRLLKKKGNHGFSDHFLSINQLKKGDKVVIYINPKHHNGMPHRRYHGKVGSILERRGKA
ncbi:TPA: 50S ribosomal protein L21e, partial [Candidatus Geothermarchaeota archaeon]|nr:50S ribosomal protein L21e [Candidatus Geothermarchaeota archaeon]